MPCTAEGGCATWGHRFIHQGMLDGAPGPARRASKHRV